MDRTLFIIVGAGASYDAADRDTVGGDVQIADGWSESATRSVFARHLLRPPLVTELFEPRFARVLDRYPLAQMGASEIRSHEGSSVALETFLRERYRDSEHAVDRSIFHAIHFYLQDLLWTVSSAYTNHPQNYDRLILAASRQPRVVFISLNYDTILDDRLRVLTPGSLSHTATYCDRARQWSLVKPHGSVDWAMPITPSSDWSQGGRQMVDRPPPNIEVDRQAIQVRRASALEAVRTERDSQAQALWFYPALSAPLGPRDTFTCPDSHIKSLRSELADQDRLDILMLGYSGLDDEVIKLFRDSGKPLGRVNVVGKDKPSAKEAMARLVTGVGAGGWDADQVTASPETFSGFVKGPGLGAFLASRS